jgi:hypothetical protein
LDPLDLGGPRRGDREWRGSFVTAGFAALREARFANPQTLDRTLVFWTRRLATG